MSNRKEYARNRYIALIAAGKCGNHKDIDLVPGKKRCHVCEDAARRRVARSEDNGKCQGHPGSNLVPGGRACSQCHWYKIKRATGWTKEAYESAYRSQNGRCALCDQEGMPIASGHNKMDCLFGDHDHATGRTRGLLCSGCNSSLGLLREDTTRIRLFSERVESYLYGVRTSMRIVP